MSTQMPLGGLLHGLQVQETNRAPRSEPLDALSDTAESATEAASEFATWIASGSRDALVALALTIGITMVLWFIRWGIIRLILRLPRNDDYSVSAIVNRIVRRFRLYFMVATALVITDRIMELPSTLSTFTHVLFVITATLQAAELLQEAAVSSIRRQAIRNPQDASTLASAVNLIKWFINVVIWSFALLLILDNIGANVTTLIAGLGIGGIAIGLAAQGMFRDLFSSLSIVLDKPFQVGDTVRYDDTWGDIEDIGLKTTRIRSRKGEQIIISNTNLLEKEIHNMRRMTRRRIELDFSLIYQTPPDVADAIPGMVAELVKEMQGAAFDRCSMVAFGRSSLDYELVFYSLNPDFNRSMALRSKVLLALFRKFGEEGIKFAYPTQTLYLNEADSAAKRRVEAQSADEAPVFEGPLDIEPES
ncbi:mechanosensitive ion channel family protein [Henriciella aquimarina]|uniref:mechanosensitive ion channel family protein n=1 Tax=Henriciella aquimarina TaxID=545261 RepID=UPI0009FC7594|nr:mechanosensitive ion channel domain-containing protein [Henriciella aquimarina]